MEQVHLLDTSAHGPKPGSLDSVDLSLDLGDLGLDEQVDETFDDLIARQAGSSGNLTSLQKCRLQLRPGGTLRLSDRRRTGAGTRVELESMLLSVAGFADVAQKDDGVIEATRRLPLVETYADGMVLREITDPVQILAWHEFAREYYYYKDYNYDLEVARQFDLNADFGSVYHANGTLLAAGRLVVRVPGYNCPFMHAVMENGSHYRVPAKFRRICEIMGLYKEGHAGVVAFKRLMESMTQYAHNVAAVDSIWTTYDASDPFTGAYYKSKLLMQEARVRLTYRDFGGKWDLIWTDKVAELSDRRRDMFKR